MYESFFGFKEKPFNITPDPKYLYLSDQHQEAIAHLLYGIQERGGFVVVTGEIGTGKTTLCRYLVNEMDERTEGAIVFNPNLSEIELLKSINQDFGIISTGQTKKELIDELNQCLLEERLRGKNMVLIIDEAQNLNPAVLEQVRMLSNLETEKEKLIQIILIGQPQLKKLLSRPELRQLDQRVTARYHLNPLSRKETFRYIQHRLDIASNGSVVKFERSAMNLVYKVSKGIPRLVNVICDRALLGAFAAGQGSPIRKKIVKQAIHEVTGHRNSFRDRFSLDGLAARAFVYSVALSLAAVVGWYASITFGALRMGQSVVTQSKMIADLPVKQPKEPVSLVEPPAAEAAPVTTTTEETPASDKVEPAAGSSLRTSADFQEAKKKMGEMLLSKSFEESRLGAIRSLLALWGKHPELTVRDIGSLYDLATSQQMRCSEFWTNFDGLRSFDCPCLLEMFVPHELNPRYVVLAKLGTENAKIFYADNEPLEVPLELLDEYWLRRAFIFWKDFEHVNETLALGDSGGNVVWLQACLRSLHLYDGQLTGEFDKTTEEAVLRFQQEKNLLLDGIVGPKTKLALYANLKQYSVPRLNSEDI